MLNAITDLLVSAKILADANKDSMLSYLIEMALHENQNSAGHPIKVKKLA